MDRKGRKRSRSEAGFTLVELMIASGIIGVSLAMTMGSLVSVSTAQRTTEADAVATTHVSSILEEIRSTTSIDDVYEYIPPNIRGLGSSTVVTVSCIDAADNEINLPLVAEIVGAEIVRPTLPNPALIQVMIQWTDADGRDHGLQAFTYHRRL